MDDATFDAWARRRQAGDESATLINLYDAVARSRGLEAQELTAKERAALSARALLVMDSSFEFTSESERGIEPIEVVRYDPRWPAHFEAWKARILSVLQPRRIDHVGSTSVPGLAAKPIVDVQVSVDDIRDEDAYVPAIESIGVQLRSRDAQHRYFDATRAIATFPARRPMLALDRVWAHPGHILRNLEAHRSALARVASDHLPLIATLEL